MTFLIKSTPENRKLVFNAIKAKILKHLEDLEKEESGELKKTFSELTGLLLKGGKGLPVGTIREWKGKKFIKVAPGKWKPKYDSETRGAKLAVSALKKKIALCEDEREMMQLVLENRDRFSDKDGNPLPFVQQLSEFISQTQEKKNSAGSGGDAGGEPPDNKTSTPKLTPRQKENLNKISKILENNVEPMPEKIDFTKENFNKLFKNGIDTPIEHVKIGENQFEKLERKNREDLLAAMADVLSNPAVIIKTADNAKLYVKTYKSNKKEKNVVSVVMDKGHVNISISTHIERNLQLAKKMDSILFERTESVHGKTPHGEKTPTNLIIPQSTEKSRDIKEKLAQWQKEGRKIVQDEHGLNFYEGMTPREKIEWIQAEIKRLQEAAKSPFLGQSGVIRYAKDDFYEGLDKDYYKNKYGPYDYKKYIKRDLKKIINKEMQEAESRHEKRKKEYGAEIKKYQEDIKYYEKQVSTPLTKSIIWLQNYLSKSGQKKESAIEVLRKRTEKGGFI